MSVLSSEDKLRLKLSAKRREAWNRYKLLPPKKVERCTNIIFSPNQEKPVENLDSDKLPVVERLSDGYKTRKSVVYPRRTGLNFSDYADGAPKPAPIGASDKAKRNGVDYVYDSERKLSIAPSRKDSPFKRPKKATVIVRKGKL